MARASKAEIAARLEIIRPLIVDCLSLREIRTYLIKHTPWGGQLSEAQLKRYIAQAHRQIEEAAVVVREREIGAAVLRLRRIIAKAAASGDLRAELAAIAQLRELLGLDVPTRTQTELSGELDLPAVREALAEQLAELLADQREVGNERPGE